MPQSPIMQGELSSGKALGGASAIIALLATSSLALSTLVVAAVVSVNVLRAPAPLAKTSPAPAVAAVPLPARPRLV